VTFSFKKSREKALPRVISADSLLKVQKRLCKERNTTLFIFNSFDRIKKQKNKNKNGKITKLRSEIN
jgi:hypothetical protein